MLNLKCIIVQNRINRFEYSVLDFNIYQLSTTYVRTVVMAGFDKWRKMSVKDQDRESVGDFYGVSMDILSKSVHLQQCINTPEEETKFSVTPKKIKIVSDVTATILSVLKKGIFLTRLLFDYRDSPGPKQTHRFAVGSVDAGRQYRHHRG